MMVADLSAEEMLVAAQEARDRYSGIAWPLCVSETASFIASVAGPVSGIEVSGLRWSCT